jgi:hypothetical protein
VIYVTLILSDNEWNKILNAAVIYCETGSEMGCYRFLSSGNVPHAILLPTSP